MRKEDEEEEEGRGKKKMSSFAICQVEHGSLLFLTLCFPRESSEHFAWKIARKILVIFRHTNS